MTAGCRELQRDWGTVPDTYVIGGTFLNPSFLDLPKVHSSNLMSISGASSGEFTLWNGLTFNFETILQAHDSPVGIL
jgi:hypothetical protein